MNAMSLPHELMFERESPGELQQQLVARMAARDRHALNELFALLADKVFATAMRILRNVEDTEEVVLDVFMQAFDNAHQYCASRGSVAGWVLVMAHSRALDLLRKRGDPHRFASLNADQHLANQLISEHQEQDQVIAQRQDAIHIARALNILPDDQRQLVERAFLHGQTHQELADQTGLPLGTVKSHIRRGMLRMRDYLVCEERRHGH